LAEKREKNGGKLKVFREDGQKKKKNQKRKSSAARRVGSPGGSGGKEGDINQSS